MVNGEIPVSLCLFEPPSHPLKYMKMYKLVVIVAKVEEGQFSRVEEKAPSLLFSILNGN
jgi:hypothetical protein